ncbi:ABC transporter permease [Paenibacillus tarimensis]
MYTPRQLFRIRLKRHLEEQVKIWRSALDWTVWLYILIPLLLLGGGTYIELWKTMPEWALAIPWAMYPIPLLLYLLLTSRLLVFIDEGDRLFLLQRPDWLKKLAGFGIGYTIIVQACALIFPFALLLPFLVGAAGMDSSAILFGYFYSLVFKVSFSVMKHLLNGRLRGWRKWTIETAVIVGGAIAYTIPLALWGADSTVMLILLVCGFILLAGLIFLKLKLKPVFEADMQNERQARLRSTELLMSQVIESKPLIKLSRPLVFPHSQRLFRRTDAGTMLAEMRMKAFVRKLALLRMWTGFISVSTYAITLTPGPVACGLVVGLAALGSSWLHQHWKQWYDESFIRQFPWTEWDAWRGAAISRLWLMLPGAFVWSVTAGWKFSGMIGAICALALASAVWWFFHRQTGRIGSATATAHSNSEV